MEPQTNTPQNSPSPVTPNPMPSSSPQSLPKSSTKKIIFIISGVLAAIVLVAVAVKVLGGKDEKPKNLSTATKQQQKSPEKAQPFSAKTPDELDKVCQGSPATNTTAYEGGSKPHPIVLFTPSDFSSGRMIQEYIPFKDSEWSVTSKTEKVQLVGCFKRISEGGTKKCELQNSTKPLNYIATNNELTVREAKTGKVLGKKEVNGPNQKCPGYASYEASDPKMYATPDETLTEEAVREFVLR